MSPIHAFAASPVHPCCAFNHTIDPSSARTQHVYLQSMHTPSEAKQLCVVRVLHSHKLRCLSWTKSSRLGGKVLMSKLMHLCLQSLQVSIFLQYDPLQLSSNTHTVLCAEDLRGMAAATAINSGDSIVTLPRTAALLVTPKMKCPFPELIDQAYWAKSQW